MTTYEEAYEENPEFETVKAHYRIKGGKENIVIIDGKKIDAPIAGVSMNFYADEEPEINITLTPLCCEFDVEGRVTFDVEKVPHEKQFELYKLLKNKYEKS